MRLRTVRDSDLEQLYHFQEDISNRGPDFPVDVLPESAFQKQFQQSGFWEKDDGMLLIVAPDDEIIGHIEFYKTVAYLDELELSYQIYTTSHRGKGVATEAVRLMTGYLFDSKQNNWVRLIIHPDNAASKRVAEKCGYKLEGLARGAWYHRGRSPDVAVYALLGNEFYESSV